MPDRPGDMDERDVDARFASIVAQWEASVPDADQADDAGPQVRTGPDAGAPDRSPVADEAGTTASANTSETPNDPVAGEEPEQPAAAAPPAAPLPPWVNPSPLDAVVPASAWRTPEPMDAATERAAAEADEAVEAAIADEEPHFEPPEVVLPPQEDLSFWGAVIGLVAGPLMLLYVVFARPFHSTRWFVAAVVVSLLGFGLLVMRQPAHRDPTSGDDGARI